VREEPPTLLSPVVAWRAWTVVRHEGRFRLASVIARTLWLPDVPLEAECLRVGWRWPRKRHETPVVGCECGIYASDLATAVSYAERETDLAASGGVFGRVALWGTVLECERGWRGTYAYPWELVLPEAVWRAPERYPLAEVALDLTDYGAPVRLADRAEWEELALLG
jgi:hypothetical protein